MGKRRWNLGTRPVSEAAWRRMYRVEAHTVQKEGRCPYCRAKMSITEVTAEHRLPVSRGGRTSYDNIDAACAWCNRKKGSLTRTELNQTIHSPDLSRDGFDRHLLGIEFRLRRATESACERLARILR